MLKISKILVNKLFEKKNYQVKFQGKNVLDLKPIKLKRL